MDKLVWLVDAGYLWAAAGELCCATMLREGLACDYAGLARALRSLGDDNGYGALLRFYWYDAARDALPSAEHLRVADVPRMKLRLGRLVSGRQKGVDSLIYRDLTLLARNRAAAGAILVTGDDDLREAVIDAQEMGMLVRVATIETQGQANAATALLREADEHIVLDKAFLSPFFTLRQVPTRTTGRMTAVQPPTVVVRAPSVALSASSASTPPTGVVASQEPADQIAAPHATSGSASAADAARVYAKSWHSRATTSEIADLLRDQPRIPRHIDQDLLLAVETYLGRRVGDDQSIRRATREAFWLLVRALGTT